MGSFTPPNLRRSVNRSAFGSPPCLHHRRRGCALFCCVRDKRVELLRPCGHQGLNLAWLPLHQSRICCYSIVVRKKEVLIPSPFGPNRLANEPTPCAVHLPKSTPAAARTTVAIRGFQRSHRGSNPNAYYRRLFSKQLPPPPIGW